MSEAAKRHSHASSKKKATPDDFLFGLMLGEGSYAKVLLAKHKETQREYATKIVDKAHVSRYNKVDEMLNERKVLSTLDHPGVVKLHYTFQDKFSLYYVLSLAPRGELFTLIKQNERLSEAAVRFYTAQMVDILEYFQTKRLIHRDFKPENVLITKTGHIKVTDFATSKLLDREEVAASAEAPRKKSFVGTAEYVAPELLNDQPVTVASDIWALGCVVYQMCVGRPPFRGPSEYLTFQSILNRELSYPEDVEVSDDLKDLIDKLLQVNASDRLGHSLESMKELKEHAFFAGVDWDAVFTTPHPESVTLPAIVSYDTMSPNGVPVHGTFMDSDEEDSNAAEPVSVDVKESSSEALPDTDTAPMCEDDKRWQSFLLDTEQIVFKGLISKRRSIFAKKRMLILTSHPRFLYINPSNLELRGEIQFGPSLWAELKTEKVFWIHTPKRDFYMEGISHTAQEWVVAISKQASIVKKRYESWKQKSESQG